jgi:hypothetical protein
MAWSKITFYYKHGLKSTGLSATTEDANYPVSNIIDGLDSTPWKGTSTAAHYITFDAGAGQSLTCDYLALSGDNLAGATVGLQFSNDNFSADIRDAFTAFARSGSDPIVKEFASLSGRYSRVTISGLTANPQITMAWWGQLTELDFADGKLDPYGEEFKGNINVTETGYLAGVHVKHYERQIDLAFEDADDALYQKIKDWWYTTGMMCFFMAWEKTGHSSDIWVVRPEKKFNNPLTNGGAYRDIKISLRGRR